jgi:hypothetical protein
VEVAERAVVHPQPAVMAEGMAVGALHGRSRRRPNVGEEQSGADLAGEFLQVPVVPGRFITLRWGYRAARDTSMALGV